MSAKLTAKETALLTAVGAKYFSFFDDGIVDGAGIWVTALTEEIAGNATYPVSDTVRGAATVAAGLARKGYAVITPGDKEDGPWFELTEAGAAAANDLAGNAAPAPAAPVIAEDAPKPKKSRKAKAAPVIAEESPVIPEAPAPAPVIAEEENFTTDTWEMDTADYGKEEWVKWTFADGSYAERRRRKVSGAWRTDFWGAAADGKRVFTLSGTAKAARIAGKFTA